ncbi:MAG: mechanosensitive ion channel family protein [Muribaculaceae bacterium]|nr:mechanosensitive ion channel family protein [Muribaculaceae bacterium]
MKRITIFVVACCLSFVWGVQAQAQLMQRAGDLINTVFSDKADSAEAQSDAVAERRLRDSLRIVELEAHVRQLANARIDSALANNDRSLIDSLRAFTPGSPVVVEGDTLFCIYADYGGVSATERAASASRAMLKCGKDRGMRGDSIHCIAGEGSTDIVCGDMVIVTISDIDALWLDGNRHDLVEKYLPVMREKMDDLRGRHTWSGFFKRAGLCLLVIVVQYLLILFTNYLYRRLKRRIMRFTNKRINPVVIRDYELLNKRQLGRILVFFSNILRWLVLLVQLTVSVPIIFAIFPQTEKLAMQIFGYILEPIKMVLKAIVDYIPNFFIIIVIWLCIKYLIKGIKYIANEIENEKLKITGFYPDWAQPSFNIIRFLLYAFMIAMIYPYLPGSSSGIFQGISVFVGLIVSLGSSTVIGNIIAGLVITYMRPFKLGDRIKLDDTVGNVIEKTPFVTRLRTPKNEVVTIPNSFIMSSHTVNYSASARQFGLIIHTTVTIGYDVPWRQVHRMLIAAAEMTPGVLAEPRPFVLETGLSDYYPCYHLNSYIKDADSQGPIMSDLHQNIQDIFAEAGIEIMSPQYIAARDGNPSTVPTDYKKE